MSISNINLKQLSWEILIKIVRIVTWFWVKFNIDKIGREILEICLSFFAPSLSRNQFWSRFAFQCAYIFIIFQNSFVSHFAVWLGVSATNFNSFFYFLSPKNLPKFNLTLVFLIFIQSIISFWLTYTISIQYICSNLVHRSQVFQYLKGSTLLFSNFY